MAGRISIIIPNRNGEKTIGACLEAAYASAYGDFEVIVADDCSTDESVSVIQRYPCLLVRLDRHAGAAAARNAGAAKATGDILFYIDADCLLLPGTLTSVARAVAGNTTTVFGGTYTPVAADDAFFSNVQSAFINYSETKYAVPDYVASHAMAIPAVVFRQSGGFPADFMPILEDVEFSHRLRKMGYRLAMDPCILVRHIFNFSLGKSLKNGFRKSRYWTMYSLANRDLHRDSGTASVELKSAVMSWTLNLILLAAAALTGRAAPLMFVPGLIGAALWVNRGLISAFHRAKGRGFAAGATLYFMLIYPVAVGTGGLAGLFGYLAGYGPRREIVRREAR